MKLKTALVGLLLLTLLWIVLPSLFIKFNSILNLPAVNFLKIKYLGLLLVAAAICMDIYLFYLFKFYGKGTPVPVEPTQKVIKAGIYNRTRNPMYLGHLVVYLGLFLYFGHFALLLLFLIKDEDSKSIYKYLTFNSEPCRFHFRHSQQISYRTHD